MTYVIQIDNAPIIRRFISFIIDFIILLPLVLILYQVWKDILWDGQSIGNKLLKLKVIHSTTGERPSKTRIIFRNLFFIVTLAVGTVTIFFNDSRKSFGDMLFSNMLVRKFEIKKN